MNYEFPVIEDLNQFRSVLSKTPQSYYETDKGSYVTFNYNSLNPSNFPPIESEEDKYIREARGIAFLKETGEIISRPFHKFFNLGERDETDLDVFSFRDAWPMEKLDGSMIHALNLPEGFRLATRAGITDVSMKAETFISSNRLYQEFIQDYLFEGFTPIFEFVAPDNKIVIKYEEPALILLDIRHRITGEYIGVSSAPKEIPIPKMYLGTKLEEIRSWEDREGVVVKLQDGHRVKIKAELYVKLHRYIDVLKSDRHFVKALFSENWDDIYSNATNEVKDKLKRAKSRFDSVVDGLGTHLVYSTFEEFGSYVDKENRKAFAEWVFSTHKVWSSVLFKVADAMQIGVSDPEALIDVARFWIGRSIGNKAGSDKDWEVNNPISNVVLIGE